MANTKNAAKMDLAGYDVSFGGTTVGWCEDVDPSGFKITKVEKRIKALGDIKLDDVITGMEGTIKVVLHQVDIEVFRQVIPGAPASGAIPLVPGTQYASLYEQAKVMTIHPRNKLTSDVSENINLVKAAVLDYKLPKMSDGKTWRSIEIEFQPYPDQTQLIADPPVMVYGYIGAIPT